MAALLGPENSMALHVLYRITSRDNRLIVYFSDIRPAGSLEHVSLLPDSQWLIREITDQLGAMGFELEHDRELEPENDRLRIFATHATPEGAGSSADAIRTVCARHHIEPNITTTKGNGLRHCFD